MQRGEVRRELFERRGEFLLELLLGGAEVLRALARRAPYPLLDTIQRKRMICQNLSSTYAYDFPEIFANVLAESGGSAARVGNARGGGVAPAPGEGTTGGFGISALVELVLESSASAPSLPPGHGKAGKLVEVHRPAGQNDRPAYRTFSTARKASWGTSTLPTCFMRRLPSFCFSSSLRLRVISPP